MKKITGSMSTLTTGTALSAADAPTSSQAMDQSAQQILNLPALSATSFSDVPSLQGDVSAVQQLASTWLNTISPQLTVVKNQIEGFGTQFDGEFTTLTSLVPQVSGGDAGAISQFKACLSAIAGQVSSTQSQVDPLNATLTSYQEQLETGDQNIAQVAGQINSAIGVLQDTINDLNGEIDDASSAGLLAAFNGDTMEALKDEEKMQGDQGLQNELQNDINALNTNLSLLPSFGTLTGQLITGVTNLSQQWQTMGATLNDVNTNLTTGSVFLNAQLQQLQGEVTDAMNVANQL